MKPKDIKIEGRYDWTIDPSGYRSLIERPATLSDCFGDNSDSRRTILWVNGRPLLLKKGRR
jgi:hypothetical protein